MTDTSLEARLDRVESTLAIQQLASRYAMAVDARDLDTWVGLFAEDVNCGRRGRGREALRGFIEPAVKTFYRSVHQVCGHVIDFIDADTATGRVYTRAEHELRDKWVVQACVYFDRYERRDGQWFFTQRDEDWFYSHDILERPQDIDFRRWPGPAPRKPTSMMQDRYPSWAAFWAGMGEDELAEITVRPK